MTDTTPRRRYRVVHQTTYSYVQPVAICHNIARLAPRNTSTQNVLRHDLAIAPLPAVIHTREDFHGNPVTFFTVQEPHTVLMVRAESHVEVATPPAPDVLQSPAWEVARAQIPADLTPRGLEAIEFLFDSPFVRTSETLRAYAAPSFERGRPLLDAVRDLMARIHADFQYSPLSTTVSTPIEEVLATRAGVCQDFAHLMIGCLRSMGLPARYVSGYLLTEPPPGQPRLVGVDASHAWLSVWFPAWGWVDVDPTNNRHSGDDYVTIAWGRDYSEVSPLRGVVLGGGTQTLSVAVDMSPLT